MRHVIGGFLLALFVTACKTTAPVVVKQTPSEPVLLSLGTKTFTTDDFFQSFTKNQLSADSSLRTDVNDYFTLYTNLKLKVLAAEAEGRDTTEAFREEMTTYRKQLAQAYLTDKSQIESLASEAYQRMQAEVNVAHILIPVAEYALPADTLTAYKQALAIRKQAQNGTDFAKLALDYSKDATTAQKGGSLGYTTAFGLIYPLETAAYTTPVGAVSQPVRTRFGYHLVKVNSRRPSRGRVRVAHILVRLSPDADEPAQQVARQRIDAIYARLQKGESFEVVCRDVSDDATSRNNGGILPPFEPGRWVPALEDTAFALTTPGDYSAPVRTNYGWHIIKLIEHKPLDSYATLAPSLRQRVTTDSRADLVRQTTVQRLKNSYPVRENTAILETAFTKADSSLLRGQWRYTEPLDAALQGKQMVVIAEKSYTVNQFFDYVQQRQQPQRNPALASSANTGNVLAGSPAVAMHRLFDRFVGDQLLATEEANLDKKFPEFRALMNEIRDGVLLSQVMEENVWERSMADSTGQRQYFEQHKADYQFPERAVATILTASTDSLLKQATLALNSKPPYQLRRSAGSLPFTKNQTTLTPEQREILIELLAAMGQNPGYVVEVSGSHDPTEHDSVSAGRIRTVVNYLQKSGVPLIRIMEKDYQGARPGVRADAQRNVTFQYFSNAREDVVKAINGKQTAPSGLSIKEGVFAQGDNPFLDSIDRWKVGTTTLHKDGKAIAVIINRIEPARAKTFAEVRGTVINAYQAILEKQWLERLRKTYPVSVNAAEMQKLAK